MNIVDTEVTAVLVVEDIDDIPQRYMRVAAPSITSECVKRKVIWYAMTRRGWDAVWNRDGEEEFDRLEAEYKKAVMQ